MTRRLAFPENPEHFIELPDRWQGLHLMRYQETGGQVDEKLPTILANFTRHVAILENWQLAGVNGNPEKWNLEKVDLREVLWVNEVVNADFSACFVIPKDWRLPSQNGQPKAQTMMIADGDSPGTLEATP